MFSWNFFVWYSNIFFIKSFRLFNKNNYFFQLIIHLLDKEIFLIFFLGMNIIDWTSIIIAIIFQIFLFSVGMNFNKKIN